MRKILYLKGDVRDVGYIKIQKYFNNPFSERRFQRSKKSLIYSVIDLDAMDARKEKSITFNVRIGSYLNPTGAGGCGMVI